MVEQSGFYSSVDILHRLDQCHHDGIRTHLTFLNDEDCCSLGLQFITISWRSISPAKWTVQRWSLHWPSHCTEPKERLKTWSLNCESTNSKPCKSKAWHHDLHFIISYHLFITQSHSSQIAILQGSERSELFTLQHHDKIFYECEVTSLFMGLIANASLYFYTPYW